MIDILAKNYPAAAAPQYRKNAIAGGGSSSSIQREIPVICCRCSTLSLLVTGIAANDKNNSPTSNHLTVLTDAFDAGADLHGFVNPSE